LQGLRRLAQVLGDLALQLAQPLALAGDPLADFLALLLDGLSEGVSPTVNGRRLA
jgi:hypothetical protein